LLPRVDQLGAPGTNIAVTPGASRATPYPAPWLVAAQARHALTFATHHSMCITLLSNYFPGSLRGRGQALYTVLAYWEDFSAKS